MKSLKVLSVNRKNSFFLKKMSDCPPILELHNFCVTPEGAQQPPCYRLDPECVRGFNYWILHWITLFLVRFLILIAVIRYLIEKFKIYISKIALWLLFFATVGFWVSAIPSERNVDLEANVKPSALALEEDLENPQ